ncbi:MAG: EAL domain-containing protein [Deltaproteobacteria bacterium]|nr:MAG: EAL domain-containing protein [Deltaproteobacteria bacterium]
MTVTHTQLLSLQFELAMSLGSSVEERELLRAFTTTLMRHLACRSAAVHRVHPSTDGTWSRSLAFSLPDRDALPSHDTHHCRTCVWRWTAGVRPVEPLSTGEEPCALGAALDGLDAAVHEQPEVDLRTAEHDGNAHLAATIPGYGIIHVVRQGEGFETLVIEALRPLLKRLGVALRVALAVTRQRQAQESRLYAVLEAAPDAILSLDAEGSITLFNRGAERLFGLPADAVRGMPVTRLFATGHTPQDHRRWSRRIVRSAPATGSVPIEWVIRGPSGAPVPVEVMLSCHGLDGEPIAVAVIRDIAARKREEAVVASRFLALQTLAGDRPLPEILSALVRLVETGVPGARVLALWHDEADGVQVVGEDAFPDEAVAELHHDRPELYRALQHRQGQAESCEPVGTQLGPEVPALLGPHVRGALGGEGAEMHAFCFGNAGEEAAGCFLIACAPGAEPAGHLVTEARRLAGMAWERKLLRDELQHRARHDALTQLLNRYAFEEALERAVEDAGQSDHRIALIFIDLDRFKHINDTLGHAVGDALLVQVARRLQGAVRRIDTLARTGGDEFVLITSPLKKPDDAEIVCARMAQRLRAPFVVAGHTLYVSASMGISLYPDHGEDAQTLLRRSDSAMYRAKANGGDAFGWFDQADNQDDLGTLVLESRLQEAVDNGDIQVHYQPQVALEDGRVLAVEALARWVTPDGEFISPGRFIPVAEESGIIIRLGAHVLRRACREILARKGWDGAPLRLAVNVSPRQFMRDDFVATVQGILEETGFAPDRLELEVTESALMQDVDRVADRLRQLSALGVTISIDDFGTGYSSFMYLSRLPVQRIKIDRSFVSALLHEEPSRRTGAVVEAIVAMADHLGMECIAEGVETLEEAVELIRLGCTEAQGFYYARPAPASALASLPHRLGASTP